MTVQPWRRVLMMGAVIALLQAPAAAQAQSAPTPLPTAVSPAIPSPTASPSPSDPAVVELLRQINAVRVGAGRLPLAEAVELDSAAQAHGDHMVANAYLDHVGSDGSQPQDRAVAAGYHVPPHSGWIVVEVISAISGDPSGPVNWWFNVDPIGHGKVLLNTRWREFGGGYARGGPYGNYWTVLVGCRPGVVPQVIFDGTAYQHTETCDS